MLKKNRALSEICFLCLIVLFVTSCSSVRISSRPAGANIFINGEDTGLLTPAAIRVTKLPKGLLDIEARKKGYVPEHGQMWVRTSAWKIIWSIFPPVLIDAMCDKWRSVRPGRVSLRLNPLPAEPRFTPIQINNIEEKLKQLEQMRDGNILTEDEYRKKRQDIIDRF